MLQTNFKIAHTVDSLNTKAYFLSNLELKVAQKIWLKIREDIQTTSNEVTTAYSYVADEEQFFFTQAYNENEPEVLTLQRKRQSRPAAKKWVANEEPTSLTTLVEEFVQIDINTMS